MSEKTGIQWTQHTGGPWLGCAIVSPGCHHCYAKELAESRLERIFRGAYKAATVEPLIEDWETRPVWGDRAPRVLTKSFWSDARAWNKRLEALTPALSHGEREKKTETVFPSMIDWLDEMPGGIVDQDGRWLDRDEVLARFLMLIRDTPNLIWLLLTKRPEKFFDRLDAASEHIAGEGKSDKWTWLFDWMNGVAAPENVRLGVSVENVEQRKRVAELLKLPAAGRFISAEPLLEHVCFDEFFWALPDPICENCPKDVECDCGFRTAKENGRPSIDWVIVGGESGPKARQCHIEWIESVVDECRAADVPVFVKQLGANPTFFDPTSLTVVEFPLSEPDYRPIKDPKGGDMKEWPEHLRVRQEAKWPSPGASCHPLPKGDGERRPTKGKE